MPLLMPPLLMPLFYCYDDAAEAAIRLFRFFRLHIRHAVIIAAMIFSPPYDYDIIDELTPFRRYAITTLDVIIDDCLSPILSLPPL